MRRRLLILVSVVSLTLTSCDVERSTNIESVGGQPPSVGFVSEMEDRFDSSVEICRFNTIYLVSTRYAVVKHVDGVPQTCL